MKIEWFDALESTNSYCKLLDLIAAEEFTVICARQQTAGVGQQGNRWDSEPGQNLTFSIILKPTFLLARDQYMLTMAVAVAVYKWISNQLGQETVSIKWPNDIYVGNRKICGILISTAVHQQHLSTAICGIGININQTAFAEWVPNPTSVKQLLGKDTMLEEALPQVIKQIEKSYALLQTDPSAVRAQYMSHLLFLGKESRYIYHGQEINATITDVDHFGHLLLLKSDNSLLQCDIKEIQFIL